ncbi:MAG: 1-(5-phosphoribosyl)-5-[(5-phosphoribosylamino)methylideneamino]imidazole-4-carboxamide isomerase [Nitrospirae bacterium]|nr:1-(5-phosphoribosyl)-5-[(5-phosphoribosylamino)methylideneamino]imidazole-4-carboxamide isomerase [Nitrospirota bacterium]MBI3593881.1 1-(5-phosphoribosyl)-5-[(5-phosphoribosylamino)methylideneamino]imidazole-4-carboxamide isomerase [Nitrospirota bacterium]
MKIFPAIDIQNGQCVRLKQGRFDQKEVFSNEPEAVARKWAEAGAEIIHVVDLDGALKGHPVNRDSIEDILKSVQVPIQVGGGIRDFAAIEDYLSMGVTRVVLGTSLIQNIELLKKSARTYPGKIVAGIDARNGLIAIKGWTDVTSESALDFGKKMSDLGIAALIYTDIEKDGMMGGPNLARIEEMAQAIHVPLVVSGGVSTLNDIRQIMELDNIEGAIIGKALYSGAIILEDALALVKDVSC